MTEENASEAATNPSGTPEAPRARQPRPRRLRTAVAPFPRAGAYYARSWQRYLSRRDHDIPVARPTLALAGHALVDELLLASARVVRRHPEGEFERIVEETAAALEIYERAGWLAHPEQFHDQPPPLDDPTVRKERVRNLDYECLSFESGYEPRIEEPGRERWLGYEGNRQVMAWMLRGDESRPWLVCVHGTSMGRAQIDLMLFRARWLHEDLGLNVMFPVLPLHGARRRGVPKGAGFPREDMLDNVHAAAQSVWDIRRVLSWIRTTYGDVPTGMTGVSLGGYVTSLVGSIDDGLAAAIVGVPLVDVCEMMQQHGGHLLTDERRRQLELAKRLTTVVSPLALTPRVPYEGRFLYAGVADRMIHPRDQVLRLWEHWGRPTIHWYQGGHAGFRRSKPVGRFVVDALVRSGLVDPSHASVPEEAIVEEGSPDSQRPGASELPAAEIATATPH